MIESPNICANCHKTIIYVEWIYGDEWRDEVTNSSICENGEIRLGYAHRPKYVD